MEKNRALFYGSIAIIFLINLITKIYYIGDLPIWYDESISLFNAQKNILRVFEYSALDNTPPIYNVFLWLWIKVFGISEFSIRFPSVIFGSVTAVLVFVYTKRKANYVTGFSASLLFTFSNYTIWYSQDARCYALVMLFSVWSLLVFDKWMSEEEPSNKKTKYLIILNTLLLYTHYLTIFILAAQFISVLLFKKHSFKKYLNTLKKTGLYFAIWAFAMIRNIVIISKKFWVPPTSENTLANLSHDLLGESWVKWIFVAVIIIGLIFQIKHKSQTYFILLLLCIVPFSGLLIISEIIPLFISRYIIYIFPFSFLLFSYSVFILHKSYYLQLIITGVLLFFIISDVDLQQNKGQDIKSLVDTIKENEKEKRTIILQTELSYAMFAYYYDKEEYFVKTDSIKELMKRDDVQLFSYVEKIDSGITFNSSQVFLVNQFSDGSDVKNYLKQNKFNPISTTNYGGDLTLTVFEK